ncbi:ATP-binding response regulator [Noviherbaspirillum soli]|uniref:ATP-binding response regulator n=1 Tax=Noviherbaspirillum soli TaxID=1064518 RepID=UPI00188B25AB|nr:hybrid sensor histidine kinase/response regulator [Noviherbaspirillum soli]
MSNQLKRGIVLKHYLIALIGVILAAALRYGLDPILGSSIPVVLFTIPVVIAASYGGFGPAIFATVTSAMISVYLFISPYYSFRIEDSAGAVIVITFLCIGLVLSLLGKRLRDLQLKAEQQAQQLQVENERKDEFLAMLAHELRNPLAGISTAGQLLKFTQLDGRRLSAASDVIMRQVKHMTELVDDLLDVSRLTRGLVIIDKQPVDMNEILHGAIDQTQCMFDVKAHQLILETSGEPACVCGDHTRLVQTVANLLGNAAKYTPAGGLITVTLRIDAGHVELRVKDNGKGLSRELLPHVFEPFVQAKRNSDRAEGGLGLGLALVEKVILLHSGTVTAYSEGLGQGSTFTIRLPHWKKAVVSQRPITVPAPTDHPSAEQSAGLQSLHLLIVDDNRDAAQGLASLLEQEGHTVAVAYHAKQALDLAHADDFDVYLLDIGLPEVDGYELLRLLRLLPHASNAKFIAITGYARNDDSQLAKKAGFHYHFAKPVNITHLAEVLGKISTTR